MKTPEFISGEEARAEIDAALGPDYNDPHLVLTLTLVEREGIRKRILAKLQERLINNHKRNG